MKQPCGVESSTLVLVTSLNHLSEAWPLWVSVPYLDADHSIFLSCGILSTSLHIKYGGKSSVTWSTWSSWDWSQCCAPMKMLVDDFDWNGISAQEGEWREGGAHDLLSRGVTMQPTHLRSLVSTPFALIISFTKPLGNRWGKCEKMEDGRAIWDDFTWLSSSLEEGPNVIFILPFNSWLYFLLKSFFIKELRVLIY